MHDLGKPSVCLDLQSKLNKTLQLNSQYICRNIYYNVAHKQNYSRLRQLRFQNRTSCVKYRRPL
uniref:Uncharacterized protein n=1 Tax=Anguilla anguilla TaxID=7936 RepID=A0A0E9WVG5_ANGAN